MPVDNTIYDRLAESWWDPDGVLGLLRTAANPARLAYIRATLAHLGIDPAGRALLDLGSGGGLLAEELAAGGCRVTGVDPSAASLAVARAHAARHGHAVAYARAAGEALPFPAAAFDLVVCCDVLEHVADLDRVLAETARVLRPGGVFLFDTINRTALARLALVTLLQDWPPTRVLPPGLHDAAQFIRPRALRAGLARHGIAVAGLTGLRPAANPLALLAALLAYKRGRLSLAGLGRRVRLRPGGPRWVAYLGYGIRAR